MCGLTLEVGEQLWKEYSYVTHEDTVIKMDPNMGSICILSEGNSQSRGSMKLFLLQLML